MLLGSVVPSFAQTFVGTYSSTGPTGLAIDTVGGVTYLYVAEFSGNQVVKFDLATGTETTVPAPAGTFTSPNGILVDSATHDLLVTDRTQNRVVRMTNTGTVLWTYGSTGTNPGQFQGPIGISRDSTGAIYVTEHDGARVQKFTMGASGLVPVTTGWPVSGFTTAAYTAGIDSGNNVYVGDRSGTIKKYSSAGVALTAGNITVGRIVTGISVGPGGAFYTTQTTDGASGNRVQRFPAGSTTADLTWGADGSGSGQFNTPFNAVVNSATNKVYVSDFGNNRVQIFDLNPPGSGDTTPPTVSVTAGATTATTATFNVTFSENVTGVTNTVFTATGSGGATASALTAGSVTGSGANYTVTVGYTGTSGSITLGLNATANTSIKDTSNNFYAGGVTAGGSASATATVGGGGGGGGGGGTVTSGPKVSSFSLLSSATTTTTGAWQIIFSEAVTGVDLSDFTGNSGGGATMTLTSVTPVSGTTYNVNFSWAAPGGTGYFQAAIKSSGTGISGASGAFAGEGVAASEVEGTGVSFTVPTVNSFTAGTPTATSVSLTLTFSEAVTGVSASDFLVKGPTGATVGAPTGSGTTYTVPITFTTAGTYTVTVIGGATSDIRNANTYWFAGGMPNASVQFTAGSGGGTAPTIAAQSVTGTVGTALNYQVVATGATSFTATGTFPAGLSMNASGVISGTPTAATAAAGTVVNVTATNSSGSSSAAVTIKINAAPPPTTDTTPPTVVSFVISSNTASTVTFVLTFSEAVTGVNSTDFTATTTGAMSASVPVSGVTGNGSSYSIVVNYSGTGTVYLTLKSSGTGIADLAGNALASGAASSMFSNNTTTPPPPVYTPPPVFTPPPVTKQGQTLTFVSPVSALLVNQPIALSATASSGMPVTFTIVTGNASVSGNTVTIHDTNPVLIRAIQGGNDQYNAATAEVTLRASKAAQSINFPTLANRLSTDGTITLNATSSAGLPITYTLISGPATLKGNVLTLTGAPGTVVLRATQTGSDGVDAATEVIRSFAVLGAGQQVFLGTMGSDAFAAAVTKDNTNGVFLSRLASTGEAVVIRFKINADGTFSAKSQSVSPSAIEDQPAGAPETAAAARDLTLTGTIANGVLTGRIAELNTSFTANAQPVTGPTASLAGLYIADIPGSANGNTYIVVGPNGQAWALAVTSAGVSSGTGTVSADGTVNVTLSPTSSIAATLDDAHAIKGKMTAAGVSRDIAGLSQDVDHTDRMINLSSRLRVTGGDASRSVIAGFVITGSSPKTVLVRAIGPGLRGFGVTDALDDPRLQVFDSTGKVVAENDDWNNTSDVTTTADRVGAFKLTAGSHDSAVVTTLAPGAYTAVVTGVNGNGVALIEVYDAATNTQLATQQLVNISTRGFVDTGDGNLIAGFVVTGNAPKRVLIRGIGPGLSAFGVTGALADPVLKIYTPGTADAIAENDNWQTPVGADAATASDIIAASLATGAFPLTATNDAAIVITLMPGNYSAVVSGKNNATGAGLIEVYEIPNP